MLSRVGDSDGQAAASSLLDMFHVCHRKHSRGMAVARISSTAIGRSTHSHLRFHGCPLVVTLGGAGEFVLARSAAPQMPG